MAIGGPIGCAPSARGGAVALSPATGHVRRGRVERVHRWRDRGVSAATPALLCRAALQLCQHRVRRSRPPQLLPALLGPLQPSSALLCPPPLCTPALPCYRYDVLTSSLLTLVLPMYLLLTTSLVLGVAVFYTEKTSAEHSMKRGEGEGASIQTIAEGAYFMWVTFSTVGYGDMVPVSPMGKALNSVAITIGLLFFAMPMVKWW